MQKQNTDNRKAPDPNTTRRQNKCSVAIENHDWEEDYITISQKPKRENIKVETENVNKLIPNIPTGNITELNELSYTEAKLVCDKNRCSSKEPEKI